MKMIKIFPTEKISIGREDYSLSIEVQPIPVIRSYQEPAYYNHTFENVEPNGVAEHITETFDYSHFVFDIYLSASANVLISGTICGYNERTDEWIITIKMKGYQFIHHRIEVGYPFSKMKIQVKNYSEIPVDIIYSHMGLKGIEKIYPFYTPGEKIW